MISMEISYRVRYLTDRRAFAAILTTFLGFWQYGIINWELFYSCLRSVIFSNEDWAVFRYEAATPGQHGALCPPSPEILEPGTYILLRPGMSRLVASLTLSCMILCRWLAN